MAKYSCQVKFYGRDYSPCFPIQSDSSQQIEKWYKIERCSEEISSSLTDDFFRKVLLKFLRQIESRALNINLRPKGRVTFYSKMDDAQYYYGGVVGVVSDKVLMCRADVDGECNFPLENAEVEISAVLQVGSRFDCGKPYFLSTMLTQSDLKFESRDVPSNEDDELFDFLLLFYFKERLQNACLKGFFRAYHRFEKNDDRLKGSIDISRHITENVGLRNGKIAYNYKEKSADNYLNHLVIATYYCLRRKHLEWTLKYIDAEIELHNLITYLENCIGFPKYSDLNLISKNINAISHPYYTEYEDLRVVCLKILRYEGVSIFDGSSDSVCGILFYIPTLWEKYLAQYLRFFCESNGLCVESQKRIDVFSVEMDKYVQETIPDFVFSRKDERGGIIPFMVLDAKFKPHWGDKVFQKKSLGSQDLLSDYDKCIRDMNTIDAHATGVIFPMLEKSNIMRDEESYYKHSISAYNKHDHFYTLPIFIPSVGVLDDFVRWRKKFEENTCDRFGKYMDKFIKKEGVIDGQ